MKNNNKHISQAWINNASTSKSPLLSLTLVLKDEDYKKNPIHVVQRDDEVKEQHVVSLSFLTPEDLDILERAIHIARKGNYDDIAMMKIWEAEHNKAASYFVGVFKDGKEQGGIYGPNPRLDDMMDVDPEALIDKKEYKTVDIYIMRINEEATEEDERFTTLFIWNKQLNNWQEA